MKKEILPKLKTERHHLARNDMERGEGERLARASPAPWPAQLARTREVSLPNDYNIYLHDMNEKSPFGKSVRAESHGHSRPAPDSPRRVRPRLAESTA
jgi:murein L,D-transpeptidase YcbB/YkuD